MVLYLVRFSALRSASVREGRSSRSLRLFCLSLCLGGVGLTLGLTITPAYSQPPAFSPSELYPTGGNWPTAIAVGEFTSDDFPDVAVYNSRGANVTLLAGKADGTYLEASEIGSFPNSPASWYGSIAVGDFNNDQVLDVLASNQRLWETRLFSSLGDGRFEARVVHEIFSDVMLVADYNCDGNLDFVTTTLRFFGSGKGTFEVRYGLFPRGTQSIGSGDIDRDGNLDLVGVLSGNVLCLLGDGDGEFSRQIYSPLSTRSPENLIVVGFLNGDEFLDLAVAVGNPATVEILLGDGMGSFFPSGAYPALSDTKAIVAGDYDHDGILDLAVASSLERRVSIRTGNGQGAFGPPFEFDTTLEPKAMVAADLDGDCRTDLVLGSRAGRDLERRLNRTSFDYLAGSVNQGAAGSPADVLLLNGRSGSRTNRTVEYRVLSSFEIRMLRPPMLPSGEVAPFALYAWEGSPLPDRGRAVPFEVGCVAMPIPLTGGQPQPRVIWNNASRPRLLGRFTHDSSPAPSTVFFRSRGILRPHRFFLQGLIYDPGSRAAVPASVTNGILGVPVFN